MILLHIFYHIYENYQKAIHDVMNIIYQEKKHIPLKGCFTHADALLPWEFEKSGGWAGKVGFWVANFASQISLYVGYIL